MKDKTYNSIYTKCKSFIGSVIAQMLINDDLYSSPTKELFLRKDITVILQEEEVEKYLGILFKKQEKRTKKELYESCSIFFKTNLTESPDDDYLLYGVVDNILNRLIKTKIIIKHNQYYYMADHAIYPNTLVGSCLKDVYEGGKLYDNFIKVINHKGGEFFEAFSVKILEEYFKSCRYTILKSQVTGGSTDNGIDGILEITNLLGHNQIILMQAKVRASTQITLKEVREFYGVLHCEGGQLGVFTTNSTYHKEAMKFINKTKDLIFIDNKKLFELAKSCKVGIVKDNNKYILDQNIFLFEKF